MSNELVFIIGLSIGALIGIVTISIFAATRITDLQSEVRDLRVQRKLLKEELLKLPCLGLFQVHGHFY